jgi:succinate dehydrogenase flavin-adding protein (antitoxin of CptAB toxin-antitoxin module)
MGNINLKSTRENITALSSAIKTQDKNLVNLLMDEKIGADINTLSEEQRTELKTILDLNETDLETKTTELKESLLDKIGTLINESTDSDMIKKLSTVKDEVLKKETSKLNYYRLTELKNGLN